MTKANFYHMILRPAYQNEEFYSIISIQGSHMQSLTGLPLLSMGAIRERSSKIRYCIIWRRLHLMLSTTNVSDKWNVLGFERMLSYDNIPKRNLASGSQLLKKIDQPSWRTTRRNYNHIPQIVCMSSRFRVLYLLPWEFERSEVLWRYTVILACHLKHVEVGWSTRNYPHTGHLS